MPVKGIVLEGEREGANEDTGVREDIALQTRRYPSCCQDTLFGLMLHRFNVAIRKTDIEQLLFNIARLHVS